MFNHSGIFIDLNSGKVTQTKGVRHNVSEMLLLFSFETQCLFSCFCFLLTAMVVSFPLVGPVNYVQRERLKEMREGKEWLEAILLAGRAS